MSKLRFSSYVYARVSAMKGLLRRREDYDRLLKMGPNEIVRFLLESPQYPEIVDLSKGTDGVEAALNKHLSWIFAKLHRMASGTVREVIATYLLRFDMENIKSIVRGKFAGFPRESIEPLLYSTVNYSPEFFIGLLGKNSAQEVVDALPFIKEKLPGNLFDVEHALDRYYVQTVLTLAESLSGKDGKIIAEFMRQEVDVLNIRTIMRLRLEGSSDTSYLIEPSSLVKKLIGKTDLGDIIQVLRRKKLTSLTGDEKDLVEDLEIDMDVSLVRKESQLMHKHPLSANQILGFMFAKEIEVRNLKTLIKGKQLQIPQDYLERLLVVAS